MREEEGGGPRRGVRVGLSLEIRVTKQTTGEWAKEGAGAGI